MRTIVKRGDGGMVSELVECLHVSVELIAIIVD